MKQSLLLTLFSLALLTGCAGNNLEKTALANPDYDIREYSTYAWSEPPVTGVGLLAGTADNIAKNRAVTETETLLANNGYRSAGTGKPDFVVSVVIGVMQMPTHAEINVESTDGFRDSEVTISQDYDAQRGGISVSFTDPDTEKTIWRATVLADLTRDLRWTDNIVAKYAAHIDQLLSDARN